jgi:hypothetical protein
MEMSFFWVGNNIAQDIYDISWHLGQENLADYQSKHHIGAHHRQVCPWYLHQAGSSRFLPWAVSPSTLKGCVGTLKDGYVRRVPLPRVPQVQSTSEHVAAVMRDSRDTCYSQVPRVLTWSDLTRSLTGLGRRVLVAFSPVWLM